jgi:uncharacterized membrane protein YqjE
MLDPSILRILLIAIAVGAIVLRVVAFRSPARRGSAVIATVALFAVLALVLGLFVWSMVGAYIGALR